MTRELSKLGLTADYLKGKQSVRATFKLPEQMIRLLSIAASQLGIKQKTLFDQLVEDRDILAQVALEAERYKPVVVERRQKTYVLSRNSLFSIEEVAREYHLPRDLLVEISINRLLPLIEAERKKQERRKLLLEEFELYQRHGEGLLQKARHLLGEEDPLSRQFENLLALGERNLEKMRQTVERGKGIEDI